MRRHVAALVVATSLTWASGCMTTRFLMTDYDDRTEGQWLAAFGIDIAVGAALVGTSFLVGDDGQPEVYTLSAGILSAGMALIIMPLASYPNGPVMDPGLGEAVRRRELARADQSPVTNGSSSSRVAPMSPATRSR